MPILNRSFGVLISSSLLLLTGAVIPASWEPPARSLSRPDIDLAPQRPWIALTFDDGPHPGKTQDLLAVLQQEGVPATFFVVGKMADRHPELVSEIDRLGHELANHTYTHPRLTLLEKEALMDELSKTRQSIQRLTGKDTLLYRPPGGGYNRRTLKQASQAGYRMVLWSVQTRDVSGASEEAIYQRIVMGATDGGIVLMHSGMPHTVEALPKAIRELRRRGYQFVTVSQMLRPTTAPAFVPSSPEPRITSPALADISTPRLDPTILF